MTRIDRLVLARLASRIGATVFIFYGIIALVESLDTWRFTVVSRENGTFMAIVMVAMSAVRWTIKTLPVTVLLGAILGIVDLKLRRELTVIKATGISIWKIIRAPTIALVLASFAIALGAETVSTQINRQLSPTPPGQTSQATPTGEVWLEQRSGDANYVLMALAMVNGGQELQNVQVFPLGESNIPRLEATTATLEGGNWVFPVAAIQRSDGPATVVSDYRIPTSSTAAEISLKLASTEDMTFFELSALLAEGVEDPDILAAASMRLIKLLALPLVLTGSLFIAFAFTAGYSRNTQLGPSVLYGIVLGFLVFIITEMADRAGTSGVLNPTFAAVGPALVAIVAGLSVLLYKEDGWT
ncbi:MAG: LptF/LptG family permease [Devosia sp.]|uniref:LptF/LptG family permease n=1 Tax=Devosia sp. TaxID=1871048 RepID=UPI0024CC7A4E|nr:LptF/LptG family permease [Devosia sp.]UYN99871.1 MAG: LptF/LptG family permease [Devosia sp.]